MKETTQNLKASKRLSLLIMLSGAALLGYMITVEGELGALPLFLFFTGTAWFVITQYRIKRHS